MSICAVVRSFIESKTTEVQTSNVGFTSEVTDYLVVHTGPVLCSDADAMCVLVIMCIICTVIFTASSFCTRSVLCSDADAICVLVIMGTFCIVFLAAFIFLMPLCWPSLIRYANDFSFRYLKDCVPEFAYAASKL